MQIKLSKLLPNPYRDIGNYPINKERVAKLQGSILNTEFWGGLVCRKHPTREGFYEIAFGHHRVRALKNLKHTEIPMTFLEYTDAKMLQAMAEENREIGQHDIKIMTQTVEQVKKYLDGELAKSENYGTLNESIKRLTDKHNYEVVKNKGVGQTTILKFLGKTWKQSEIQFALNVLEESEAGIVDREAVESFKNKYQATEFKTAVKEAKIPVKKQREVAKKIKSKVNGGRAIKEEVFKHSPLSIPKTKKSEPKVLPMLDEFIEDISTDMSDLYANLLKVKDCLGNIQASIVKKEFENCGEELLIEMKSIFGAKQ